MAKHGEKQLVPALWMCSESTWLHGNECKFRVGSEVLKKQREWLRPTVEKLCEPMMRKQEQLMRHCFSWTWRTDCKDTQE